MALESEIAAILMAKADALIRGAADDLAALIHPDFVYVNARGVSFTKTSYIDGYCRSGEVVFHEQRVGDLETRQLGEIAIASFLVHDRYTAKGTAVTATYVSMAMFARVGDRWLWVSGHTKA